MTKELKAKLDAHEARFHEATYGGNSVSGHQAQDHALILELAALATKDAEDLAALKKKLADFQASSAHPSAPEK